MPRFTCAVCHKGPAEGVAVFRMNDKGQPGLWACNEHKDQFDGQVDAETMRVVRSVQGDPDA